MSKTVLRDLYKCSICGNVVEIVDIGMANLVCCGKPMDKLTPLYEDVGKEKHVPVIESWEKGIMVKVGSVPHPMEEKHYIRFIEVLTEKQVLRAEFKPGEKPEAIFSVNKDEVLEVREYCNLHGLWSAK
jgi:superoxide reductase